MVSKWLARSLGHSSPARAPKSEGGEVAPTDIVSLILTEWLAKENTLTVSFASLRPSMFPEGSTSGNMEVDVPKTTISPSLVRPSEKRNKAREKNLWE